MPRFYIHIHNGLGDQPDRTGIDCVDARAAVAEAAKMAGELMRDEIHDSLADAVLRVAIEDEAGSAIGTIDLALSLNMPT